HTHTHSVRLASFCYCTLSLSHTHNDSYTHKHIHIHTHTHSHTVLLCGSLLVKSAAHVTPAAGPLSQQTTPHSTRPAKKKTHTHRQNTLKTPPQLSPSHR